jgi:hypothetical protein
MNQDDIVHVINGPYEHTIIFNFEKQAVKIKLIDYLAIYSRDLLISKIEKIGENIELVICADIKDARKLLNYLRT